MKKIAVAVLSLALLACASPAFARHKKSRKDPRITAHPKAVHQKNEQLKHAPKHKAQKRPHNA